jgi:hypothetical protein
MTESIKFESFKKKLQGICEEHNLVFRFRKESYPIHLIIKTSGDVNAQMTMLEEAETEGFRSPDARLIFAIKDGELSHQITGGKFEIDEALFRKLQNLFKKMHSLWLQFFQREIVTSNALSKAKLPHIESETDEAEKAFEESEKVSTADKSGGGLNSPNSDPKATEGSIGSTGTKGKKNAKD